MAEGTVIAKRLKEARLRAELSQKQLGIKAGIDEFSASARINQYERAKHTPDFSTVERLAKVLKTPTPFFYCRDNELAEWILAHQLLPQRHRIDLGKRAKQLLKDRRPRG